MKVFSMKRLFQLLIVALSVTTSLSYAGLREVAEQQEKIDIDEAQAVKKQLKKMTFYTCDSDANQFLNHHVYILNDKISVNNIYVKLNTVEGFKTIQFNSFTKNNSVLSFTQDDQNFEFDTKTKILYFEIPTVAQKVFSVKCH